MNASQNDSINNEILIGFIDEALDELVSVVGKLIELRNRGFDEQSVQALFRVFHSIKGNAAYFELFLIKDLSHSIEQVLDEIRKQNLPFTPAVSEILIDGTNAITEAFVLFREKGIGCSLPDSITQMKERLTHYLNNKFHAAAPAVFTPDLWDEIVADFEIAQSSPNEVAALLEKYRAKRKLCTNNSLANCNNRNSPTTESPLKFLRDFLDSKANIQINSLAFTEILRKIEQVQSNVQDSQIASKLCDIYETVKVASTTVGLDSIIRDSLHTELNSIENLITEQALPKTVSPEQKKSASTSPAKRTMRISEESVDNFLEFVGELVIIEDLYGSLTARGKGGSIPFGQFLVELKQINETFGILSRDLQKSIMEIRKVPINVLFSRMPKIINEVAHITGKKISFITTGESLRVDKTILEKLESPLVHMIRNAADHGIEKPEIRRELTKPEEGCIKLSAEEHSGSVTIRIADDGAGLNLERLRSKAIELGIIHHNEVFDQHRIIASIFHSGVSTAESVTEISGRGVGMDVVKRNIEDAGGEISIITKPNEGTEFCLKIPSVATTQIISGFVVRAGEERFILPLDSVEATMRISGIKIESVTGKGYMIKYKGETLSITRLENAVEQVTCPLGVIPTDIVVVIQNKFQKRAYLVSAVDGIRQVVKKHLQLPENCMKAVVGAAIMGDGKVSLVLNIDHLFL